MAIVVTKGIVLQEMSMKEHDKRIIVFSQDFGKITVFANGAKRPKSALLAGTQTFIFGEFHLYEGRNSFTLKHVEIIESFIGLRQDLINLSYGMYFLEICTKVVQEMDPNQDLLRLLYVGLKALEKDILEPDAVRLVFEFRSLSYLGFQPDLNDTNSFILKDTDADTISVLRYIQEVELKKLFRFELSKERMNKLLRVSHYYFTSFVPDDFKTLEFLKTL